MLDRVYRYPCDQIAAVIERLLQVRTLIVENEREVFLAMTVLKQGRADFTDLLISALGARAGYSTTMTFDRKAAWLPGFSLA